ATASSTAYWLSGLSTMGSSSLGMALVAGRKRVPRPATGKTALRMGFMSGERLRLRDVTSAEASLMPAAYCSKSAGQGHPGYVHYTYFIPLSCQILQACVFCLSWWYWLTWPCSPTGQASWARRPPMKGARLECSPSVISTSFSSASHDWRPVSPVDPHDDRQIVAGPAGVQRLANTANPSSTGVSSHSGAMAGKRRSAWARASDLFTSSSTRDHPPPVQYSVGASAISSMALRHWLSTAPA